MTRHAIISAALLLALPGWAPAPALAQDPLAALEATPTEGASQPDPGDFDLAKKRVEQCEGEKFVFAWGAGANPTKVTLCSNKGATPAEIVRMLEDAAAKLEQTPGIAEDRKTAIIQQIRAKAAELKPQASQPPPAALADVPASPPQAAAVGEPASISPPAAQPVVAEPSARSAVAPAVRPAMPARPRLSITCATRGERGAGGPCTMLGRDTLLTVTADEALSGGATLRFSRKGRTRAEIALRQMARGQSVRIGLPREMCAGVFKSEATIEVIRSGQVVESIGPYQLRC